MVAIGLSDFGQRSLGDILCVTLPKVGDQVTARRRAGLGRQLPQGIRHRRLPCRARWSRSTRPWLQNPAHINAYPYSRGGVLKVRVKTLRAYEEMLSFDAYADLTSAAPAVRRMDQGTAHDVAFVNARRTG